MTNSELNGRPSIDDLQADVKHAYDALGAAWNRIDYAQRRMRAAGVPDLIVDHLEGTRLACVPGDDWREVVEALAQIAEMGQKGAPER
jgi:hypothetical protein